MEIIKLTVGKTEEIDASFAQGSIVGIPNQVILTIILFIIFNIAFISKIHLSKNK